MSAIIGSALLLGACGEETTETETENTEVTETEGTEGEATETEEATLEGDITIDGSSTVYPIMEAVAEEFMMANPNVNVTVGLSGTGGGFEKFTAGETQISDASRPIKDEEVQALADAGIEWTEFKVANDGLSVVVNTENDWVDYLTVEELAMMWKEDGTAKKWSDIREGWPEEEIKFYSPGTDSGTFDYFNEEILEEEPMVEAATLSEDDNVLVQGVTGDKNAIGFFGYAYYIENQDSLKVVPIDNGEGPVEPTAETVEDGSYAPLSRPLFFYVDNAAVKDAHVYEYVKFVIENSATLSEEVGYVKLEDAAYEEALSTLEGLK
ncbi:PstS family phosphate ABC transporter substrate-binding protein [Bacillus coahuilensis]|nr:PstS family phosphate ABC transporter substrate-binding protein [Bacillus coahuilensis]